jgi:hypothetical protein
VGFAVGLGVGFGVGFGVGLGVGVGVGGGPPVTTARDGETDRNMAKRAPPPDPLCAVKTYCQVPAGNRRDTENVTPPE